MNVTACRKHDDEEIIVGDSVDAEEEFGSDDLLLYWTPEEMLSHVKRNYKKRANMGLAWYHTNNPVSFNLLANTP
jgi:hypothetical protein